MNQRNKSRRRNMNANVQGLHSLYISCYKIGRPLTNYKVKTIFQTPSQVRRPDAKDKSNLLYVPGVYIISASSGTVYVGETKRSINFGNTSCRPGDTEKPTKKIMKFNFNTQVRAQAVHYRRTVPKKISRLTDRVYQS